MGNLNKLFKNLFIFKEPMQDERYILKEKQDESYYLRKEKNKLNNGENDTNGENKKSENRENGSLIGKILNSKNIEDINESKDKKSDISKKLSENLQYIKNKFTVPKSSDVIIREFSIPVKDKLISAFIIFIDGMVNTKLIDDDILKPLMLLSNLDIKSDSKSLEDYIKNHIFPHNQMKIEKEQSKAVDEITFGSCALYVDGLDAVFVADVKGWEHRNVERPNIELIIHGPQEGFNESIRANTALIRKRIKDENLVIENIPLGKRSKTPCAVLYIKDIADDSLVKEVKRRLESISVDYLFDTGELEQFIEDSSFILAPQILSTERPDRVSSLLVDGRIAIIMNGSPFALLLPVTNNELMQSAEDIYIRFPYANLLKIIRYIAMTLSLLLPGIYVAITSFHQEMLPTDLVLAISSAHEKVPFPTVVEIIIMELSFELIREAGIRIPGPVGPTLGIIGALILGQAAVAANIVSPILIIIVAVTGIGSFAIPNYSLAFSFRILRFIYIFLGAIAGFLGITLGLFLQGILLAKTKTFGVPFLSPFAPRTKGGFARNLINLPIWMQEDRPDYLNAKIDKKQDEISRGWTKK